MYDLENVMVVKPHLDCGALGRLGNVRLHLVGEGVVALVLEGAVVVVKDGLVRLGDPGP